MRQQEKASEAYGKPNTPPAFLVYDDTMFDRRFPSSPETRKLFMNGRHYNIFTLITSQYAMDLPPAMRANIDFVMMFNEPTKQNRIKLYNNFGGIFPSFNHFERVFLATTEDYHCMVINNTSQSHNTSDVVFRYKSPEKTPPFAIGSRRYWDAAGESDKHERICAAVAKANGTEENEE